MYDPLYARRLILKVLALIPVAAFWVSPSGAAAAALYDTLNNSPQTIGEYAILRSPTYFQHTEFDFFSTSTNVVLCNVTMLLHNTSATSGIFQLKADAGGTVFDSLPVYSVTAIPSAPLGATTTFSFEPCFTIATGDGARFYFTEYTTFGENNGIYWLGTQTTSTALPGYYSINTISGTTFTNSYAPNIRINGVDAGSSPNPADFGLTGTSTNPGDFGLFGNYFISAMSYLFVPPPDVVNTFSSNARASLGTRIPFGWFAYVSSTLSELSNDGTTSTAYYLSASSTTSTVSIKIFDPQAIEAQIPASILALVRTLGSLALWAAFFLWIWRLATGTSAAADDDV